MGCGPSRGANAYGSNAAAPSDADPHKPAAAPFSEATVEPCSLTRPQLHELLKESQYGAIRGAYNAYFREDPSGDGGHLCRACGLVLGMHREKATDGAAAAAGTSEGTASAAAVPPPTIRLTEMRMDKLKQSRPSKGQGSVTARPVHWKQTAWFARFLEFDSYGAITSGRASVRWRCIAPDAYGRECGATFLTKGLALADEERPMPGAVCDMSVLQHDADTIEKHFNDAHQVEHQPGPGWTTSLCGCCASPAVLCSCVFCYCWPPPVCCLDGYGAAFCCALQNAVPQMSESKHDDDPNKRLYELYTRGISPDHTQCSWSMASSARDLVLGLMLTAHLTAFATLATVATVLTLAGFPCNSDSFGPIICWPCFDRRRKFARALNAGESSCKSRAITVFCCPCSEVQQYRELAHSGVWAGLMCCKASAKDKAAMAPEAVRERYGVDGMYGVRPVAGAGPDARRLAASLPSRKGPVVQVPME